jgi:hypothetical protein
MLHFPVAIIVSTHPEQVQAQARASLKIERPARASGNDWIKASRSGRSEIYRRDEDGRLIRLRLPVVILSKARGFNFSSPARASWPHRWSEGAQQMEPIRIENQSE